MDDSGTILVVLVVLGILAAGLVYLITKTKQEEEAARSEMLQSVGSLPKESQAAFMVQYNAQRKNPATAVVLCWFLGGIRAHRSHLLAAVMVAAFLLAACAAGLPQEAEGALHSYIQQHAEQKSFTITAARRATSPNAEPYENYDEMWCVVIDPPMTYPGFDSLEISHFMITRKALLWEVDTVQDRDWFLRHGCDNY